MRVKHKSSNAQNVRRSRKGRKIDRSPAALSLGVFHLEVFCSVVLPLSPHSKHLIYLDNLIGSLVSDKTREYLLWLDRFLPPAQALDFLCVVFSKEVHLTLFLDDDDMAVGNFLLMLYFKLVLPHAHAIVMVFAITLPIRFCHPVIVSESFSMTAGRIFLLTKTPIPPVHIYPTASLISLQKLNLL